MFAMTKSMRLAVGLGIAFTAAAAGAIPMLVLRMIDGDVFGSFLAGVMTVTNTVLAVAYVGTAVRLRASEDS